MEYGLLTILVATGVALIVFVNHRDTTSNGDLKYSSKRCPKCGAAMVIRDGKFGKFWGCSNYGITGCKGK